MKHEFEINPDAMDRSELLGLLQALAHRKGNGFSLLRRYIQNKMFAIDLRLEGNIQAALTFEKACDNIYGQLPSKLKSW